MEKGILDLLKNISIENLLIGLIIFFLTMIIKTPIKKLTSKLQEEKRKAINTIIVIIPPILSLISTSTYLLINKYSFLNLVEMSFDCWIVSIVIYAIYEKVLIVIKGTLLQIKDSELSYKESNEIEEFINKLDVDDDKLTKVEAKIQDLLELKKKLKETDITTLYKTDIEIEKLKKEENNLKNEVNKER